MAPTNPTETLGSSASAHADSEENRDSQKESHGESHAQHDRIQQCLCDTVARLSPSPDHKTTMSSEALHRPHPFPRPEMKLMLVSFRGVGGEDFKAK